MTDKNGNEAGREPCCEDRTCCSVSNSGAQGRNRAWQTGVFAVVILLAIAVTAYSLFWRGGGDTGGSSCCPGGSEACATTAGSLPTIAGLNESLAGLEFALVILPGLEEELPQSFTEAAAAATTKLKASGVRMSVFTLRPDDSVFKTAVNQFEVTAFPAVLALGQFNNVILTQGRITEEAILKAYQQDLAKIPACYPLGGVQMDVGGNE